jgi:hypothetical protein
LHSNLRSFVCIRRRDVLIIYVSPEEGDERAFLFTAQVMADPDDLGGVFAHHNLLRRDGGVGGESGFG